VSQKITEVLNREKIGILLGGSSSEREISLKSGEAVYNVLKEEGLNVIKIDVVEKKAIEQFKESGITLAFIAMHGGFGEDGRLQCILEKLKIPYTGSGVKASQLAMDKVASRKIFVKKGINVPKYRLIVKNEKVELNGFKFPLVVKPSSQGSSMGLTIVDKKDKLPDAVKSAFQFGDRVIVESYIEGREITVGIFNEEPLPIIEIIPKRRFFDFKAKYESGQTNYIVPADIKYDDFKTAQKIGLFSHRVLGCRDFSRVDMILSKEGRLFVLEVNTIPGLTKTSLLPKAANAVGIDFSNLCKEMLKQATLRRI